MKISITERQKKQSALQQATTYTVRYDTSTGYFILTDFKAWYTKIGKAEESLPNLINGLQIAITKLDAQHGIKEI